MAHAIKTLFVLGTAAIVASAASANTVISQNFDGAGIGSYTTVDGASFGAGVGGSIFPTGNALYFAGNDQGRSVTFAPVDLSAGGKIGFSFVIGDYNYTDQSYFENADGGTRGGYDEDVTFAYSTNGGTSWTSLDTYSPTTDNTGTRSIGGWTNLSYTLGASASLASTTLRFLQPNNSSSCCDHWAVDNVLVTTTGAVPEPATWAMFIGGFGMIGGALRRRPKTRLALA